MCFSSSCAELDIILMQGRIFFKRDNTNLSYMINVLYVESDVDDYSVNDELISIDYRTEKIQYSSLFLTHVKETSPEIIIINLKTPTEKLTADLQSLSMENPTPVIMFAKNCCNDTIKKIINVEVTTLIVDGLPSHNLASTIQVAKAQFNQRQELKHALEEARTQLEDRKQIDRAKAILIKTRNFSEDEAYHTLRKLAMDRKIALGEMARNVIAMAELLK